MRPVLNVVPAALAPKGYRTAPAGRRPPYSHLFQPQATHSRQPSW